MKVEVPKATAISNAGLRYTYFKIILPWQTMFWTLRAQGKYSIAFSHVREGG